MKYRWIRYILLGLTALFIIGFIIIYFLSDTIFNIYFNKYISRFNNNTNATLSVSFKKYSFPNSVEIGGVSLVSHIGDTLVKIDSLSFNVKLISILKRDPSPSDLFAKNILVNILHTDSLKNYDIRQPNEITADTTTKIASGYNVYVNKLFSLVFNKIPPSLDIKDILIHFTGNYGRMIISVPTASIDKKQFMSDAVLSDDKHIVHWRIRGNINSKKEAIVADIKQIEPGMNAFVGVLSNTEMLTGFDTLHMELDNIGRNREETTFTLRGNGHNMKVFHHRLANDTVTINSAGVDLSFLIKQSDLVIDVPSNIKFGDVPAEFYVLFSKTDSMKFYMKYTTETISSQDFFNSLPKGIFENLNGIQTSGNIFFHTEIGYDFSLPDSAIFTSQLKTSDFSIKKMGKADLRMMNSSFIHNVYERGRLLRSFTVGPGNPSFTPIDSISPFLRNSILTSEDGNFYSHNGFNEDAFRQSIVENIQKRRFARGGSTITMQLVKNVYLKRDKVISRKLEEALIVWLIESQKLVSKHRMFEVYLNIIEWGPGVYGINEASQFYFTKHPSELDLAESIFLASIVPRPKLFRYSFDEYGNLRGYLESYYRLLAGIMLRRGQISQMEYDSLTPQIILKGPARDLVLPPDSIETDPWLEDINNGE